MRLSKINVLIWAVLCLTFSSAANAFSAKLVTNNAPVILKDTHDKVIAGLVINNVGQACIQLINCKNIVIKNCRLSNSKKVAIYLFRCKNVRIIDCYMENVATGVYALECQGINIQHNQAKNMLGPFPRGQMVQFDDVTGPGNNVSFNSCENILGQSYPEDAISMYKSSGTAASPIIIAGNRIRGGGPSKTGGGIMLGDNGGAYIIAKNNILVNPGQYGMAISGGTHITISHNTIFGKRQAFTNVGLYIWSQSKAVCGLNTIEHNKVRWYNAAGEMNNSWNNGNCGPVQGWDTNQLGADIDSLVLPVILIRL